MILDFKMARELNWVSDQTWTETGGDADESKLKVDEDMVEEEVEEEEEEEEEEITNGEEGIKDKDSGDQFSAQTPTKIT